MKRVILSGVALALSISAGCGTYSAPPPPSGTRQGPAPGQGPGPGSSGGDTFLIDAGAGVTLPPASYAVTTNGADWVLSWTGDAVHHQFSGEILNGGTLSGVVFDGGRGGDQVTQPERDRVVLDAVTDDTALQAITFTSDVQPVRFNLLIDNAPAIGAVVFSSGGRAGTTDVMPFDLQTASAGVRAAKVVPAGKATAGLLVAAPSARQGATR